MSKSPPPELAATYEAESQAPLSPVVHEGPRLLGGRYELMALLGAGAMGTVYRARDRELDEVVALKVLRHELVSSPSSIERFRREVKLARRVTHRNVARAFDIGEHDGERFLTMELVEGEALSTHLERHGALPGTEAVDVAAALCEGLSAAHEAGVVHRDLKPDNVVLSRDGRVVITDFGIARSLSGEAGRTGGALGTPAYMAPEQVEGGGDIDARADLYALGVMLFQMLTGDLPFKGDSPYMVALARLSTPPPDPRWLRPDVPPALSQLVLKLLARSPQARPSTATEALAELRAIPRASLPTSKGKVTAQGPMRTPTEALPSPDKTLAVLPFRNLGPEADLYLADGLTEDLIDLLSMSGSLKVRPLGAARAASQGGVDAREAGEALGVQVVAEGSLRRAGERVRVSVRLITVGDGFQLWARRFEVPIETVLSLSDEVAQAISGALDACCGRGPREEVKSPEAIEAYLRGRSEYHRFDRDSMTRAVAYFEQARRLAPRDPSIVAGHALSRVRQWFYGTEGAGEQARLAVDEAISVAPGRGEPLVARGYLRFLGGDIEGAVTDARAALALSPALADAHELLGRILIESGPVEAGLPHLESALSLEPSMHHAASSIARAQTLLGRRDLANDMLDRAVAGPNGVHAWVLRARLACWSGDLDEVARLRAHPDIEQGKSPVARALLDHRLDPESAPDPELFWSFSARSPEITWRTRALLSQLRAEVAAQVGRVSEALDALEQGVSEGLFDVVWVDRCPALSALRGEERFAAARGQIEARARQIRAVALR